MMNDIIEKLLEGLEELSPMPADDDTALTVERLRRYNTVIEQIQAMINQSTERDIRLMKSLIRSFGYGDAYESYWPVIHVLEKFPLEILRPELHEAIQSGERGVRLWCTYMLGRQRNREDVPVLVAALKDPEYKVRCKALQALSMIGEFGAQAAMEELLNDPVEEVRKIAQESIDALLDQGHFVT